MSHPTPHLARHDNLNEARDERYAAEVRHAAKISLCLTRRDALQMRLDNPNLAEWLAWRPFAIAELRVLEEVAGFAAYGSAVHLYTMGAANEAAFLRRRARGLVVDAFSWVH